MYGPFWYVKFSVSSGNHLKYNDGQGANGSGLALKIQLSVRGIFDELIVYIHTSTVTHRTVSSSCNTKFISRF